MGIPEKLPWFLTQADGEIRAAGTRVSLVEIVHHYNQGFSAEMLGQRFPTVDLAAIHHIIGFFIQHRQAVDALVAQRFSESDKARNNHVPSEKLVKLRQRVQELHAARVKHVHAT